MKFKPAHKYILIGLVVVGLLWLLTGGSEGLTPAPTTGPATLPPTKAAVVLPTKGGSIVVPTPRGTAIVPTKPGGTITVTRKPTVAMTLKPGATTVPTKAGSIVVPTATGGLVVPTKAGGAVTVAPQNVNIKINVKKHQKKRNDIHARSRPQPRRRGQEEPWS